jgi:hypothetical protein
MPNDLLHNESSQSILKALLYYDIFNYPLTSSEVLHNLSTNHITHSQVKEMLHLLSQKGYVFNYHEFFSVQHNEDLIQRRRKGNEEAQRFIELASRKAKFIHTFPFVRSVMASGSLSKNYMDENSDLDFFVITEPGRLWIARTLLILYKRIFLLNSHKWFCINYLIDSEHLEIEEQNIFTATELSTLIPLCGHTYYFMLLEKNNWLKNVLPNHQVHPNARTKELNNHSLKNTFEKIINSIGPDKIDDLFMKLTYRRWENIYQKEYSKSDFQIAFKTNKHTSKNHPRNYQKKVVDLYHEKLDWFAKKFNIHWLHE